MQTNKEKKQLRPYQGLIVFVLVILMFLFIAAPIQEKLGLYGVVLTEVIILLFGFIPAILWKADLKEVFPIKKPGFRQMIGVVLLWFGSFLAVTLVTLIMGYFFPEGLAEVSDSLQDVFTSLPMGIAFLIIAVTPAICEEALVRGFILSSFGGLKNKWLVVLIVGILFGIFHLDPYRFLPTALLGMILTYIMIETKNIILPALFHFINNGFSTIVTFLTPTRDISASLEIPVISIGVYFILCAASPFLLLAGANLLHKKVLGEEVESISIRKKQNLKNIWIAVACSIMMAIIGFVIVALSIGDFITEL